MSKYKGLYTFDVDNHRYVTVGAADGIIDCMDYEPLEPAEPLIKDEKMRKAVRAWAEAVGEEETFIVSYNIEYHDCCIYTGNLSNTATIDFGTDLNIKEGSYTIAELCGEEEE